MVLQQQRRERSSETPAQEGYCSKQTLIKLETIQWKLKKFVHITGIQIVQQTVKFNIILLIPFCATEISQQTATIVNSWATTQYPSAEALNEILMHQSGQSSFLNNSCPQFAFKIP